MTLEVIGAGLGRTGTLSLKFALEILGFGPCQHMSEVFADGRRLIPLWREAAAGRPDWEAIFAGFRSTCDYPAATYWRELASHYPDAPIVLTSRDPESWAASVSETVFSPWYQAAHSGTPEHDLMHDVIFADIDGDVADRRFLAEWFERRNRAVVEALPPERLLLFDAREGWEPLCAFLDVPVPAVAYPAVNSRRQLGPQPDAPGMVMPDPALRERMTRIQIDIMRESLASPKV